MSNNKLIYGIGLLLLAAVVIYIGSDLSGGSFFSKRKDGMLKSSQDSMSIPNVSAIVSECDCDIEIIPSNEERVVMYYDKKDYQNKSDYTNNELHLDFSSNRSNFHFFESSSNVTVKVYCKSLSKITQSGVGDVKTRNTLSSESLQITNEGVGDMNLEIDTKILTVNNTGVGDVKLKGNALRSKINNEGTGDVEAKINKTAAVVNTGVGDVDVFASDSLDLNNSGVGDITYKGAAFISSVVSEGVGKVEKK
jgi:Putative auto-transporter adhesin, head GIN domain